MEVSDPLVCRGKVHEGLLGSTRPSNDQTHYGPIMAGGDAQKQAIAVPSEDPAKKDKKDEDKEAKVNGDAKGKGSADGADGKKDKKEDELSEEDLQLKNELEMLTERLKVGSSPFFERGKGSLLTLAPPGIGPRPAPAGTRVVADADSDQHIVNDLRAQASQIPPPPLSRPQGDL